MSTISSGTTVTTAFNITGDTSGELVIKTGPGAGTTAMTIDAAQNVAFPNPVSFNGPVVAPAGTAAAPAITTSSDTNTGIFFPAADTIAFAEGGVEALRITSTGNLSFSTTGQRITGDFSNSTLTDRLMFQTSVNKGQTFVSAITNGSGAISAFRAFGGSDPTNANSISIQQIGTSESRLSAEVNGTASYAPMTFYTGGSERMRLDTSGNVGIGQSSPSYKLQINNASASSTADAVTVQNSGVTGVGHVTGIRFRYVTAEPAAIRAVLANASTGTGSLEFFTSSDGTGANLASRMRISPAGYVAIGRATMDTVRLFLQGSTTGASDYALLCYDSAEQVLFYTRNDGYINTGTRANSPYNLTTGSAANMFVDSAGGLLRSTSSLRYKSDITDASHGLADVLKLRSVTYKGKNDGDKIFGGLIAEEVHDAGLTEFVAYDKEGRPDALHYGNMVALLVKAVQELSAKVAALEAK